MAFLKRFLVLLIGVLFLAGCDQNKHRYEVSDPAHYEGIIQAFSSGYQSVHAPIVIQFAKSQDWKMNEELPRELFQISPNVKGKVQALSENELAFISEKPLKGNQVYRVQFAVDKLSNVQHMNTKPFVFSFKTYQQSMYVKPLDFQSATDDRGVLNICVETIDKADVKEIARTLTATLNGQKLPIKIVKNASSPLKHYLQIDHVAQSNVAQKLKLTWNGKSINSKSKGDLEFEVPAIKDFSVISVYASDENNKQVDVNFSQRVSKQQDLFGLIHVAGNSPKRYSIRGNVVRYYFESPLEGKINVTVSEGVLSVSGKRLENEVIHSISFNSSKPNVRYLKNGFVMPSSQNLQINFEAVNLKKVDVKVFKIYHNNVLQFLQRNEYTTAYDLRYVAKPVGMKTIELTHNDIGNMSKWNAYALDLSELIKPEEGAVYRVELSFKKSYALLDCADSENEYDYENYYENQSSLDDVRSSDMIYDYYYEYDEDDQWLNSRNPCMSYYYNRPAVGINVLSSDLGILVKRGQQGQYVVAVNNLLTTEPVEGAKVDFYNFQMQRIAGGVTNHSGILQIKMDAYAFFAIVSSKGQHGYLRMDENRSLSVNKFDVEGEKLQNGWKGYIYGERGVWRPGDTLHLGFILEDKDNQVPTTLPIKLRLNNPLGKSVYQHIMPSNKENHYLFKIPTSSSDLTGNWEAVVTVGGATFYKSIKIETIKPNRLKIDLKTNDRWFSNIDNHTSLQVNWLHGAAAKNFKTDVSMMLKPVETKFKGFEEYIFDDPLRTLYTEDQNLYSGTLDDTGRLNFEARPQVLDAAAGMLSAIVTTKVSEPGGDFSIDVRSLPLSPYLNYVGLKPQKQNKYGYHDTGKDVFVDVVVVDYQGRLVPNKSLNLRMYKQNYSWWWEVSSSNRANYVSSNTRKVYQNFEVRTNDKGIGRIKISIPNKDWGAYLLIAEDVEGKHSSGISMFFDWSTWKPRSSGNSDEATQLTVATDKKKYSVGESIEVSFPSSAEGRALISVENGSRIISTQWVPTDEGETNLQIKATEDMATNAYISIVTLQPHATSKNDLPIRMYGIASFEVYDPNSQLLPKITMPSELKPEQNYTIQVQESAGKPMTYTLAVVDEGLLNLTRFKTPNAWESFRVKQALGVYTWDIYNQVIGAFGGKINQIFGIGGDEYVQANENSSQKRFVPVVKHIGPFTLKPGQIEKHNLKMDNYLGSVRVMVIASNTKQGAYGSAEKTVAVKKPMMILSSVPRKISPNEEMTIPITVFAMEPHVKKVTVHMESSKGFTILNGNKQEVTFDEPGEKLVYFKVRASDVIGKGKIHFKATSGAIVATNEVFLDNINPNPVITKTDTYVVNSLQEIPLKYERIGTGNSNENWLELSGFPNLNLQNHLDFLLQYPHGCTEQITSTAFPQLYLERWVSFSNEQKTEMDKHIKETLRTLHQRQHASGGFSTWDELNDVNDWATSYAGHFFLSAEKEGYLINPTMKKQWIGYQQKVTKQWKPNRETALAQAYRLYTLALAGNPDLASMNRMKEIKNIGSNARFRLAAAYAIAGQRSAAKSVLELASENDVNNDLMYYGSPLRNNALLLETYVLLNEDVRANVVATKLAKTLSNNTRFSTQETAFSLYALSKHFVRNNAKKGIHAQINQEGKTISLKSENEFLLQSLSNKIGKQTIKLRNNSESKLYVSHISKGIPSFGSEDVFQSNLKVTSRYYYDDKRAWDGVIVRQGEQLRLEIKVTNTSLSGVKDLALTQYIPSGFELISNRLHESDEQFKTYQYKDLRDDRAHYYFDLKANQTKTFVLAVNASYLGKYYQPGAYIEAMYDTSYSAREKGFWLEIVNDDK